MSRCQTNNSSIHFSVQIDNLVYDDGIVHNKIVDFTWVLRSVAIFQLIMTKDHVQKDASLPM
jgi:hypothetical protein